MTAYLRQFADDELYRRNAFRVTAVATDAGPRVVRERQKKDAAAAAVGVVVGSDPRLPLPQTPTAEEVRAAFEVLADPRRRLVHELFWLWGDVVDCGCAPDTHERHDRAVRAHAAALEDGGPWADARASWVAALDDAGTWAHLRTRVATADARRLGVDAVDELRAGAPRALVATVVARAARDPEPARLRGEAERWGLRPSELDDLLLDVVHEDIAAVEAHLVEARARLDTDPRAALRALRPAVVDELDRIDDLAPADRFRPVAELRNDAAIVLNNAALAVVEREPAADVTVAVDAYQDALSLATDPATRATVTGNRESARRRPRTAAVLGRFGLGPGQEDVLMERMVVALESRRLHDAHLMVSALLEIVDDPGERAQLRDVQRRIQAARTQSPVGRRHGGAATPVFWVGLLLTLLGAVVLVVGIGGWGPLAFGLGVFLMGVGWRRA
ncbi:hypothetical protein [Actinomycetospora aeridis]|uniref:Uncharacterized protein n=1 Tax=Actinomycetospora aeridis TaxID=3129231 RepID=A0ABU8N0D3_9PSEU